MALSLLIPPSSSMPQLPASETNAVDTLRALAIAGVLAHHVYAYGGFSLPYLDLNGGLLGVQLFFIISGYLIVQSAQKYRLGVFVLHRFFRIFPPYLFALLVFAGGYYLLVPDYRQAMDTLSRYFLLNIVNLQFLHPASVLMLDPLHVGWSLTVELFWYAVAPLMVWWCGTDNGSAAKLRWLGVLLGSVLAACLWIVMASHGRLNPLYEGMFATVGLPLSEGLRHGVVDNAPPAQLMFFVMGACLHVFRTELQRIPSATLWLLAASVLLFVPQWGSVLELRPNPLTGLGIAAFFVWMLRTGYADGLTRWLAKVSYSLYLIHAPILVAVFKYLQWNGGAAWIAAVLLIGIGAEIGWRWVERPSQALGKRLSDRLMACEQDGALANR